MHRRAACCSCMHARARARKMYGAYAAVRRSACMLLVLTLRVNQQQDQRGRLSTFLLASSYPPTPSYILAWGQHVTTPLPFSKRRARRLASGQKESCINSKGKRLESAEKRSRITAVSSYGHRLLLRSPRPSQGMISSQGTILAPTNERNLEHRLGRQTHENRLSPSQARTHESLVYYKVHETVVQEKTQTRFNRIDQLKEIR